MPAFRYNRLINQERKFAGFHTIMDIFIGLGGIIVMFAVFQQFIPVLVAVLLYEGFGLKFRYKKPAGYFWHWLHTKTRPPVWRPGHSSIPHPVMRTGTPGTSPKP
jgi:hypothetical protein